VIRRHAQQRLPECFAGQFVRFIANGIKISAQYRIAEQGIDKPIVL